MRVLRIILISTIIVIYTYSSLFAQSLTSPNYSLTNPRMIITGGNSASSNYSLNRVSVGNVIGGISGSLNYTLDATRAALEALEPLPEPDITPPIINSVTPLDGVIKELTDTISVTCLAQDDNSPIQYRFSVNGTVAQDWNIDSTFNWATHSLSSGVYPVLVEVKDIGENEVSETIEVYLIRKPVALP